MGKVSYWFFGIIFTVSFLWFGIRPSLIRSHCQEVFDENYSRIVNEHTFAYPKKKYSSKNGVADSLIEQAFGITKAGWDSLSKEEKEKYFFENKTSEEKEAFRNEAQAIYKSCLRSWGID